VTRGIICAAILAATSLAPNQTMANTLDNPPHAVDDFRTARNRRDFRGEACGMGWDAARRGIALDGAAGWYVSEPQRPGFGFQDILPSWNIALDERTQGYRIHLRVADEAGRWSPWFYFGSAGTMLDPKPARRVMRSAGWGEVDVDHLRLSKPAAAYQYRVSLENRRSRGQAPALLRFSVCASDRGGDEARWKAAEAAKPPLGDDWLTTLPVPYRSQRWIADRRTAGSICCPTCIAMVLEGSGVSLPTLQVAGEAFDAENGIYGNWPRAAQLVVKHGLESYVTRFRRDEDVKRMIARGLPVVASIRARKGELTRARYDRTAGHLILIRGFTRDGDYIVNDPYSEGPEGEESVYPREDIRRVWFDKGGAGIVILNPRPRKAD
jgi:hypothetical protein